MHYINIKVVGFAVALFFSLAIGISNTTPATALSGSEFKAGLIIDDALFYNGETMSASQIQNFLNSKVPTCDTNGSQGPYYDKYGKRWNTRADYGRAHNSPPPYTCIKSYSQNTGYKAGQSGLCSAISAKTGRTAAQIIDDVARACHISQKAIIVMLQKEQGLVTDDWPWPIQYRGAMGYGCPDTAACDSEYYGFFNQVYNAALQFQRYKADPSYWNHVPFMTNQVLYQANAPSCGSRSTYIENYATAGLYNYTPYTPNTAALNNLYGTGDGCSAYGNRNFWRYYNDWFGSTQFPQPIGATLNVQSSNGRIFLVTDSTKFYIPSNSILKNYGFEKYGIIPTSDSVINSYADGGILSNLIWNDNGVFLVNNGYKHHVSSAMCGAWVFPCSDGSLVKRLGSTFDSQYLKAGNSLKQLQLSGSVYYKMEAGKKRPFANDKSISDSGHSKLEALHTSPSNTSQPLGKLIITTPGMIKFSPKASIYFFNGTKYYSMPSMDILRNWNLTQIAQITPPTSSYNSSDAVEVENGITYFAQANDGKRYVINDGTKFLLSSQQQQLWQGVNFISGLDILLANLKTLPLQSFIKADATIYQISLSTMTKDPIPSMSDYSRLGGNSSNISHIPPEALTPMPTGTMSIGSGTVIKIGTGATLYKVNGDSLMAIPNMNTLHAYGSPTPIKSYSEGILVKYPLNSTLNATKLSNGSVGIPYDGRLLSLSPESAHDFGVKKDEIPSANSYLWVSASKLTLTRFMRNIDDGKIYYASGGTIHYVATYDAYVAYGGHKTSNTTVDSGVIEKFHIGSTLE